MIDPTIRYSDPGTEATLAQPALAGTAGIAAAGKVRINKINCRPAREAYAGAKQVRLLTRTRKLH